MIKYRLTKDGHKLSQSKIKEVNMDEHSTYHGFEENEELYLINSHLNENVMTINNDWRFTQILKRSVEFWNDSNCHLIILKAKWSFSNFINNFPKSTLNFVHGDNYYRVKIGTGVRIFDYFWILGGSIYNDFEGKSLLLILFIEQAIILKRNVWIHWWYCLVVNF